MFGTSGLVRQGEMVGQPAWNTALGIHATQQKHRAPTPSSNKRTRLRPRLQRLAGGQHELIGVQRVAEAVGHPGVHCSHRLSRAELPLLGSRWRGGRRQVSIWERVRHQQPASW